jgi:hypothetical protein
MHAVICRGRQQQNTITYSVFSECVTTESGIYRLSDQTQATKVRLSTTAFWGHLYFLLTASYTVSAALCRRRKVVPFLASGTHLYFLLSLSASITPCCATAIRWQSRHDSFSAPATINKKNGVATLFV